MESMPIMPNKGKKVKSCEGFCLTIMMGEEKALINLLDLQDIREILQKLSKIPGIDSQPLKEKSTWAVDLFQEAAKKQGVELKLRRKK